VRHWGPFVRRRNRWQYMGAMWRRRDPLPRE
jgi:hypothetical protein